VAKFRRRFRKKFTPLKTQWVTTVFQTGINRDGSSMSGQVLIDSLDWEGELLSSVSKQGVIRRIVANWCYQVDLVVTELAAQDRSGLVWALWIEDDEEIASQLDTTAVGDILQENRVLATGMEGISASGNDTDNPWRQVWSPKCSCDWSGRLTLKGNERIVLGHHLLRNLTNTLDAVAVTTISRVLIEQS